MEGEASVRIEVEETEGPMSPEATTEMNGDQEAELPSELVKLVFEDENHNARTLQALNTMRKNKHFCDVVLHVGNTELHAHRAVLASVSPHLFQVFTTDDETKGSQRENVITYKLNGGFDKLALEKLVDYAYTSKLEVTNSHVQGVYLAAQHLKMERVVKECVKHFIKQLNVENCIETRLLPGISKSKSFAEKVDAYIAKEFGAVSKTKALLALPCVRIEVLNQTRQEMSLVVGESVCQLILDWVRRQCSEQAFSQDKLTDKTHLLYLALDNSLQDCCELPTGDVSDTEIVQDYKKMSKKSQPHHNNKGRRKGQMQPAKPRVLIYSREITEQTEHEKGTDWCLIATERVAEHNFLALTTIGGNLATMSVLLRLNQPSTPSPVLTPIASRPPSEEKPDLYCLLANMSSGKCAVGCANLNDTLVVFGGYDRAECLKCVEAYDPAGNGWLRLAPMKEARGRFSVAVVHGLAYAVAGSNGSTELSTVERFDPNEGRWTRVTPLPLARCNTGVCELDGYVYCIGGWNGQAGIKQCDRFDPDTNQWTSIAALQTGRYQAGVCSYMGRVIAGGGCDSWNCLNTVEAYDPATNSWSFTASLITARRGCGLAEFKGKLYAVGGSDGTHSLSCTEVYDPEEQAWSPGPSMTTPRANVGVTVIGNRLYAVGGFSGKAFLNSIEYLDEGTDEWTTFVPKVEMGDSSLSTFSLSVSSQSEDEDDTFLGKGKNSLANSQFQQVEEALQNLRKHSTSEKSAPKQNGHHVETDENGKQESNLNGREMKYCHKSVAAVNGQDETNLNGHGAESPHLTGERIENEQISEEAETSNCEEVYMQSKQDEDTNTNQRLVASADS